MALPLYNGLNGATRYLAGIYNLTFYGHELHPDSMSRREMIGNVPPCPLVVRPDWDKIWKGSKKDDDTDSTSEDSFQTVNLL